MAKLLIVDDENDVLEFAANFFRKRKIDVSTATSGEEALDRLGADSPDLILLDIQMEGINGIETLERLRQINKDIKVIMVTGKAPMADGAMEKCLSLGALDYIHKPLKLDELERVVLRILCDVK
ncbi:MAG: response regulator [Candidatus Omnitrophota bacterium]|nr:response regulator [Candidatus Omnitrophota bacterium]MBU1929238.1 response regulator [Candidatus Omnitrophota bacterium]MBU2034379.1 response regulator [Candidatus Omnitrophota bacterium]MBU2258092.1 response regulator [Candidatus Omnitrophota bacterium]